MVHASPLLSYPIRRPSHSRSLAKHPLLCPNGGSYGLVFRLSVEPGAPRPGTAPRDPGSGNVPLGKLDLEWTGPMGEVRHIITCNMPAASLRAGMQGRKWCCMTPQQFLGGQCAAGRNRIPCIPFPHADRAAADTDHQQERARRGPRRPPLGPLSAHLQPASPP